MADGIDISVIYVHLVPPVEPEHEQRNLYCVDCGEVVDHTLRSEGSWEHYRCPAGHVQSFRVG